MNVPAPAPAPAPAPKLSTLSKAFIAVIIVLVVGLIVVVVLAVKGVIGPKAETGPLYTPAPNDDGRLSCAGSLPVSSLSAGAPYTLTGPSGATGTTFPTYTFQNKGMVYKDPAGDSYYLTYVENNDPTKRVVKTSTPTTEWSLSANGFITSSKALGYNLAYSPGSSYVELINEGVCASATVDANGTPSVACKFIFDGNSFYALNSLNQEILKAADILYWYDARESLSLSRGSYEAVGTAASTNCSNIALSNS